MTKSDSRLRDFLVELRRRRVYRGAAMYAGGAFVLVEVADLVLPAIPAPDWIYRAVVAAAFLGFPIALLLAWMFDITPEGITVTAEEPASGTGRVQSGATPALDLQSEASERAVVVARLPTCATPLIGRDVELERLIEALHGEGGRLVTLIGPGGSGKTRLAIAAANELARDGQLAVAFVTLETTRDPDLVLSAIAQALRIREERSRSLAEAVEIALTAGPTLLVLDNFEQVISAAPVVAGLLAGAPSLRILVTSREPLRVAAEREFPLDPLTVPDPERPPSAREISRYGGVALFAERARAVRPDFEIDDRNAAAVASICARLDGIPLAIELAAARVKVLSPEALADRLERRLDLLQGGSREAPERQRTLRQTIAWSYQLLEPDEQGLFRRLSVFAGRFDLDAARQIAARAPGEARLESEIEILDGLASLVDKSLLLQEAARGEPSFRLLETIREYGEECLEDAGETAAIRARHASYYVRYAEEAARHLSGPEQLSRLQDLMRNREHLRAAISWLGRSNEAVPGLRLCVSLWRFWEIRGLLHEGRARLTEFLDLAGPHAPPALRKSALYAQGVLADAQGDSRVARESFEATLAICREAEDSWGIANTLNNLGIVALREGDHREARSLYEESLAIWRELGNEPAVALSLNNLGNVAREVGDHEQARSLHRESLEIFERLGDRRGAGWAHERLGDVARADGRHDGAARHFEKALSIFRELGLTEAEANVLADLGELALASGQIEVAGRRLRESLALAARLGAGRNLARLLDGLAVVAAERANRVEDVDEAGRAVQLAAAAAGLRKALGTSSPGESELHFPGTLERVRARLDHETAERLAREGSELSAEEAVQYALREEPREQEPDTADESGNRRNET